MMGVTNVWCFLVTGLLFISAANGIAFQSTPSTIIVGTTEKLKLYCAPAGNSQGTATLIQIKEYKTNNYNGVVLAEARQGYPQAVISNSSSYTGRCTATGWAGSSSSRKSYLQLEITQLTLADATKFMCSIKTHQYSSDSTDITVQAQISPKNLVMSVYPDRTGYYVDEKVELRCMGNIGDYPGKWMWEWRLPSEASWSSYPDPNNIKQDTYYSNYGKRRNFPGQTSLIHAMTKSDNGRMFRCILKNDDNFSVRWTGYLTDGARTTKQSRQGGQQQQSGLNDTSGTVDKCKGMVPVHVAVVAGIVPVLIVLTAGGIFFFIHRYLQKKRKSDTRDTNQDRPTIRHWSTCINQSTAQNGPAGDDMYTTLAYDNHVNAAKPPPVPPARFTHANF